MLAFAGSTPELATARLQLRELVLADADAVAAGARDREVAQFLSYVPSPYPLALARRWIRTRRSWWHTGDGITLAIADRDAPAQLIGSVSLHRSGPRRQLGELGYWLARDAWGRGLATEAAAAIVELGARELGLTRMFAEVVAANAASQRVLEKLGFAFEKARRTKTAAHMYIYARENPP